MIKSGFDFKQFRVVHLVLQRRTWVERQSSEITSGLNTPQIDFANLFGDIVYGSQEIAHSGKPFLVVKFEMRNFGTLFYFLSII